MGLVTKSHEVWKVMDFGPFHGLIALVFFSDVFDRVLIGRHNFMAPHTCIKGWYTSRLTAPSR